MPTANWTGVVGLGNIGHSTLQTYRRKGYPVVCFDISERRIGHLQEADRERSRARPDEEVAETVYTSDPEEFARHVPASVFISVPTEMKGIPSEEAIVFTFEWLCRAISANKQWTPVLVIESTMTPGTTDKYILPILSRYGLTPGVDLCLGISPRRDWFNDGDKNIETMERVYGGVTERCKDRTEHVIGLINPKLFRASTYQTAELTKCLENAFRFVNISLANQFALAYPDISVSEVLELAATKWNMGSYYPSLGIGGHCVPVSPRYSLEGAADPEYLTLLRSSVEFENVVLERIVETLVRRNHKRVGILGLAYRKDVKISVWSPAIRLARLLADYGCAVKINDPLFDPQEIEAETGVAGTTLEDCLEDVDALVIVSLHQYYINRRDEITAGFQGRIVISNENTCRDWQWADQVQYYQMGDGLFFNSGTWA